MKFELAVLQRGMQIGLDLQMGSRAFVECGCEHAPSGLSELLGLIERQVGLADQVIRCFVGGRNQAGGAYADCQQAGCH